MLSSKELPQHLTMSERWRAYAQMDGTAVGSVGPWWWRMSATFFSELYGLAIYLRSQLYSFGLLRSRTLPGRTISIGNLAAGGTGKSPLTIRLAELLVQAGGRPAILTRGYGSDLKSSDSMAILGGKLCMNPVRQARAPDEGMMQSVALPTVPVIIGRERYAAAQRFLREQPHNAPTHWLLDDGMQHWQLARDFELVLLDARAPLPRLLPRGVARERVSALKRADSIILTRCSAGLPTVDQLKILGNLTSASIAQTAMLTRLPEHSVEGGHSFDSSIHAPICLVSAVAQPEALLAAVTIQLGLAVAAEIRLADHGLIDRRRLLSAAAASGSILTTAKDYWRDPRVFAGLPQPVFILQLIVMNADAALQPLIRQLI